MSIVARSHTGGSVLRRHPSRIDASHTEGRAFLQHRHQIDKGASTAFQLPQEHDIQLALLGGLEQCLALRAAVFGARGNLLHCVDDGLAASGGALVYCVQQHGSDVLVVGRDPGIEGSTHG